MKTIKIITASLSVGAIVLLALASQFLIVTDKPTKSDVIIVLTGGGIERHQTAVSLFRDDFAPFIIVSNSQEDGIYEAILKQGVPSNAVIKEEKADSTYTNAQYTFKIMNDYNFKSAIVVSSDYHMRRVKFNFNNVFRNSDIRLTYFSAQTEYSSNIWFTNKESIRITLDEYTKILGNALGFNGTEDKQIFKKLKKMIGLE